MLEKKLKTCKMIKDNKCLGCQGLSEYDWIGSEQCDIYKREMGKNGKTNIEIRNRY